MIQILLFTSMNLCLFVCRPAGVVDVGHLEADTQTPAIREKIRTLAAATQSAIWFLWLFHWEPMLQTLNSVGLIIKGQEHVVYKMDQPTRYAALAQGALCAMEAVDPGFAGWWAANKASFGGVSAPDQFSGTSH